MVRAAMTGCISDRRPTTGSPAGLRPRVILGVGRRGSQRMPRPARRDAQGARVMYRLLALDLDGTVIGKDRRITNPVRTAVAAAQARDVCVTLVTGRMFRGALHYAQQLSLRNPLICYQGALVRHPITNAVLHHTPMSGSLAAEAITLLHRAGTCVIACID